MDLRRGVRGTSFDNKKFLVSYSKTLRVWQLHQIVLTHIGACPTTVPYHFQRLSFVDNEEQRDHFQDIDRTPIKKKTKKKAPLPALPPKKKQKIDNYCSWDQ